MAKTCQLPNPSGTPGSLAGPARAIAQSLHQDFGAAACAMDQGVTGLVWPQGPIGALAAHAPLPATFGQGDSQESVPEIFSESFRRLEALRFGVSGMASELCPPAGIPNFFCAFRDRSPFLPPWVLDDGRSETGIDAQLRAAVDAVVSREAASVQKAGHAAGTPESNRLMALGLIKAMTRPRAEGGLGLTYAFAKDNTHFRRDAVQAYAAGEGDCNAFSFIFFAMAERAGLSPAFIRVAGERSKPGLKMTELFHIGVSVRLDPAKPSERTAVDPGRGFLLKASETQWYELGRIEMMAHHLRNTALFSAPPGLAPAGLLDWREARIRQAAELAPHDFEILFDAGKFFLDQRKDAAAALPFANRAVAVNPSLQALWKE